MLSHNEFCGLKTTPLSAALHLLASWIYCAVCSLLVPASEQRKVLRNLPADRKPNNAGHVTLFPGNPTRLRPTKRDTQRRFADNKKADNIAAVGFFYLRRESGVL
ncbi:hypothetical protein [Kosakonia sacchari]|uniref:hypothetical protein n=1 Tax=Kosakonia sacchari TaxID=1158459 RepID=UPI001143C677|nr:hypothetical protein [Kosakonia sacchari]